MDHNYSAPTASNRFTEPAPAPKPKTFITVVSDGHSKKRGPRKSNTPAVETKPATELLDTEPQEAAPVSEYWEAEMSDTDGNEVSAATSEGTFIYTLTLATFLQSARCLLPVLKIHIILMETVTAFACFSLFWNKNPHAELLLLKNVFLHFSLFYSVFLILIICSSFQESLRRLQRMKPVLGPVDLSDNKTESSGSKRRRFWRRISKCCNERRRSTERRARSPLFQVQTRLARFYPLLVLWLPRQCLPRRLESNPKLQLHRLKMSRTGKWN